MKLSVFLVLSSEGSLPVNRSPHKGGGIRNCGWFNSLGSGRYLLFSDLALEVDGIDMIERSGNGSSQSLLIPLCPATGRKGSGIGDHGRCVLYSSHHENQPFCFLKTWTAGTSSDQEETLRSICVLANVYQNRLESSESFANCVSLPIMDDNIL